MELRLEDNLNLTVLVVAHGPFSFTAWIKSKHPIFQMEENNTGNEPEKDHKRI